MKVYGQRSDGSLLVSLGGGVGVIMRGEHASKPTDLGVLHKMGPWDSKAQNDIRAVAKQLDRCRTVALTQFHLGAIDSLDDRRERMTHALRLFLGLPRIVDVDEMYVPLNGLGEDWVVYCMHGKHYGLAYGIDEQGMVVFDGTAQELVPSWDTLTELADTTSMELKCSPFYKNLVKSKTGKK